LQEDDLDALTDLIHRAYAPHLAIGLRYWATHQPWADTEKRLLSGVGLIMLADGEYVGTATVRPPQPNSPVALYRDPAVRSLSQFCVAPERLPLVESDNLVVRELWSRCQSLDDREVVFGGIALDLPSRVTLPGAVATELAPLHSTMTPFDCSLGKSLRHAA
jgi:hypothetical protein